MMRLLPRSLMSSVPLGTSATSYGPLRDAARTLLRLSALLVKLSPYRSPEKPLRTDSQHSTPRGGCRSPRRTVRLRGRVPAPPER